MRRALCGPRCCSSSRSSAWRHERRSPLEVPRRAWRRFGRRLTESMGPCGLRGHPVRSLGCSCCCPWWVEAWGAERTATSSPERRQQTFRYRPVQLEGNGVTPSPDMARPCWHSNAARSQRPSWTEASWNAGAENSQSTAVRFYPPNSSGWGVPTAEGCATRAARPRVSGAAASSLAMGLSSGAAGTALRTRTCGASEHFACSSRCCCCGAAVRWGATAAAWNMRTALRLPRGHRSRPSRPASHWATPANTAGQSPTTRRGAPSGAALSATFGRMAASETAASASSTARRLRPLNSEESERPTATTTARQMKALGTLNTDVTSGSAMAASLESVVAARRTERSPSR